MLGFSIAQLIRVEADMKCSYSSILRSLVVVALAASAAFAADDVKDEINPTPGVPSDLFPAANCDLTGYKSEVQVFPTPVPIPDTNAAGVTVGPIVLPDDGSLIADVILDLQITHTWIGDIKATVGYDANNDAVIDAQANFICRPGSATGCAAGTAVGCSSNFLCANGLVFDDAATASLPTAACTSTVNVAAGCYKPTGVGVGTFDVFNNLRKGGSWYLLISDNAAADLGTICGWSVHILNQTQIGVANQTWSNVKRLYN